MASLSVFKTDPFFTATAIAVPVLLAVTYPKLMQSYRGYIALGPGGIPHNFFGWALQGLLQPLARQDTISHSLFAKEHETARHGPHSRQSFLGEGELPTRDGERPTVPGYVAPQRQTTEQADKDMEKGMQAFLARVVDANPGVLALKPSRLEGAGFNAIFFTSSSSGAEKDGATGDMPLVVQNTKGELCHVHGEGSTHLILSLTDAEEVVRKGWAQRHAFSGVLGYIPVTYVMIYAPRNDREFAIWKRLVGAAVKFVCAGVSEVKVEV